MKKRFRSGKIEHYPATVFVKKNLSPIKYTSAC